MIAIVLSAVAVTVIFMTIIAIHEVLENISNIIKKLRK